MTSQRRFKDKVRARMERTGERYAAARGAIVGKDPAVLDDSLFEMADERIVANTGRSRAEWFAILDAAGATERNHGEIAAILTGEHGVPGWWAQTVTVDYERARGLRQRHERPDGFEISKSKTLAAPLASAYAAWAEDDARAAWLDGDLEITTAVEGKRVRGRWAGGQSRLHVEFTAKGDDRTVVHVVEGKLPDAEAAERAKADWAARLSALADHLAG